MKVQIYESLSQRVAAAWRDTLPPFVSMPDIPASEASQRQFHAFLLETAEAVSRHPERLDLPCPPDDAYHHGEMQNHRPELINAMLKIKGKLDDFLFLLLRMGLAGTPTADGQGLLVPKESLRIMEKTRNRLANTGLCLETDATSILITCPAHPDMFPAWVWLAGEAARATPEGGKKNTPPQRFTHGIFNPAHPHGRDQLLRLCDAEPGLKSLTDWLEKNGYRLVDCRNNRLTADWVKSYGKREEPLKDAWGERTHGGFAIEHEWIREKPVLFSLRMPEFKKLLEQFDAMPSELRRFVVHQTKKCDGCGYCTQTDKTGKRKIASVQVNEGGILHICPLFPGFSYNWRDMDVSIAENIQRFLLFADACLGPAAE